MYTGTRRIQDFKLGGAHLKKLRRAEGGAKIFGVFRVKNQLIDKSHHDRTYVTFKCGFSNQKTFQRTIWDYKGGDYTLMRQKIIDTNWETLINDYRYTLGNFDK
jgi:hypothetical protein